MSSFIKVEDASLCVFVFWMKDGMFGSIEEALLPHL